MAKNKAQKHRNLFAIPGEDLQTYERRLGFGNFTPSVPASTSYSTPQTAAPGGVVSGTQNVDTQNWNWNEPIGYQKISLNSGGFSGTAYLGQDGKFYYLSGFQKLSPVPDQQSAQQYYNQNYGGSLGSSGSALPPEYSALLKTLQGFLGQLQSRGQVINPNVTITPELAAQFMSQAKNEIDPFYSNQLKLAKDSILASLGYSEEQILQQEKQAEQNYKDQLRGLQAGAAETGMALSGRRVAAESELASNTQFDVDSARRALSFGAGQAAGAFAQTYGAGKLTPPQIPNAPQVIPGQESFQTGTGTSPLYQLSDNVYSGITGSQEYQKLVDEQTRASQLEAAYRSNQALQQARQLTI